MILGHTFFSALQLLYSLFPPNRLTQALKKAQKQSHLWELRPLLLFGACEQAARHWKSTPIHSLSLPLSLALCFSLSLPAARGDILSHTIWGLVLFQESHSALLPLPFHTALLGEALQGLAQPGLSKAIRANYRYPVTGAMGRARWGAQGPGRRAGVSLGQKEEATLGPTLSQCLPGSQNWQAGIDEWLAWWDLRDIVSPP